MTDEDGSFKQVYVRPERTILVTSDGQSSIRVTETARLLRQIAERLEGGEPARGMAAVLRDRADRAARVARSALAAIWHRSGVDPG